MTPLIRKISFDKDTNPCKISELVYNEWLVTNGLGGYASASISGATTRKYHGLLVAALPAPFGRINMFNYLEDQVKLKNGSTFLLSSQETLDKKEETFCQNLHLSEFRLEEGLPVWTYEIDGCKIEKRLLLVYLQNTLHISYRLIQGPDPIELSFQPFFNFRHHESPVTQSIDQFEWITAQDHYKVLISPLPTLYVMTSKPTQFTQETRKLENIIYRIESERGYDSVGRQKSPGYFSYLLYPNEEIIFTFSTENLDVIHSLSPQEAFLIERERRHYLMIGAQRLHPKLSSISLELVLAADQFIVMPSSRLTDIVRARAIGEEARTIIAGYHWFTDWGRDTMISLEGLTLVTGRIAEAEHILRTFAYHIHGGLIPNLFPDGKEKGIYTTADATLWFLHAIDRFYAYTQNDPFIKILLPKVKEIIYAHIKGTLFGIHVDPNDGLLSQGAENLALTWMDAKMDNLVITPRRGKTVEINALWYNALRLAAEWTEKYDSPEEAAAFLKYAKQCYQSFNEKFWIPEKGYLYDLVEGEKGNDSACRPNQLFSIALKYPVLKEEYWKPVLQTVQSKLLTAYGLRTLSSDHEQYKVIYHGNLFLRDSAYHQGTVWPWLIGPFIDAWLRVYPDKIEQGQLFLKSFQDHLNTGCIGSINEIFDAETPFLHRGCIAQAWSVAEVLRCLHKLYDLSEDLK